MNDGVTANDGKLFGRADALLRLRDAYQRCCHDNESVPELVLITGHGGVGKTALASALKKEATEDHGFFLQGKFDALLTSTINTHAPVVEAFNDYCNQTVACGAPFIRSVREAISTKLTSSELAVLLETVPELRKIIGEIENKEIKLSRRIVIQGADAEEGFVGIMCKFLHTISSQGYPVALLVDDIQWSTPGAIALLKAILAIGKNSNDCRLLVICTCRVDDTASSEPVSGTLVSGDYRVTEIELCGLDDTAVHQFTSHVLGVDQSRTKDLARMVGSMTRENPFHILQLLKELQEADSLYEYQGQLRWGGRDEERLGASPSVMLLIRNRIGHLPKEVQNLIKVASCLGTSFFIECLKAGILCGSFDVIAAISIIQQKGIFECGSDPRTVRFTHDEFRQAAYGMIPENERKAFHLDVGRRLWHRLPSEQRDHHLRLIADQISCSLRLVNDDDERSELGRLFLLAGQKAAQESSFKAAAGYLQCGILLHRTKHWQTQYKLSLALYNTAAEVEYFSGNFARVEVLVDQILTSANAFDDTLVARFTRIYCIGSRSETSRAVNESLLVLRRLGERFPLQICYVRLLWELRLCSAILHRKSSQEILNLPTLTDTKKLTSLRLINIAFSYALFSSNKFGLVLASRAALLTLQSGLSEQACASLANLGIIYASLGKVDTAYLCSQLALILVEKYEGTEWQGRVTFSIYAGVFPLKRPLRESIDPLLVGHKSGLASGDINFSLLCVFMHCRIRLYAGDTISDVLKDARMYRNLALKHGQEFILPQFDTLIQFCLNLLGEARDPFVLTGDGFDEVEALRAWETKSIISYMWLLIAKHFMAVYMNDHALAESLAVRINAKRAGRKLAPYLIHNFFFLETLTSATLSRTCSTHKRQALRLLLKLQANARHCPSNYLHRVHLVEAELLNSSGCHDEALAKYDLSIELAGQQGIVQEQALACERAGHALRESGKQSDAVKYLEQACVLFSQWGAQVKVNQLSNDK